MHNEIAVKFHRTSLQTSSQKIFIEMDPWATLQDKKCSSFDVRQWGPCVWHQQQPDSSTTGGRLGSHTMICCIVLASHLCTRVLHGQLSWLHTLKSPKFFHFRGDFHQKWRFAHPKISFAHPELPFLAKSMICCKHRACTGNIIIYQRYQK